MGNNLVTDGGNVDVYFTKYKSYVALISQSETGAPTAAVMNADDSNYLGDIVWTRTGVGYYVGTLAGAFPFGKTYMTASTPYSTSRVHIGDEANPDAIFLLSFDSTDESSVIPSDNILFNAPVEIRVYP